MPLVLDRFALVDCIGGGASQLLQGQTTADIISLKPGECCFFCLCNVKGRMIVNGLVLHVRPNSYHLVIMSQLLEKLLSTLSRYVPFYKVALEPSKHCVAIDNQNSAVTMNWPETVHFALIDNQLTCKDARAQQNWFIRMMTHGIVFIEQPQDSEIYLPSDTGWDAFGVNFTKGCYTGQEIIARVHYRGAPKRKFYVALLAETLCSTEIIDQQGQKCGSVVSTLDNGDETCIAACIDPAKIGRAMIDGQLPNWRLINHNDGQTKPNKTS